MRRTLFVVPGLMTQRWTRRRLCNISALCALSVQEQPAFDKKAFTGYIKGYLQKVAGLLPEDEAATFKANSPAAVKWLLGKLSDLQL